MFLKDKILESFDRVQHAVKKTDTRDAMGIKMRGYVEITAKKNGVIFYRDGGSNHVTYWARHALMNMIRGKAVSSFGSLALNASNANKYISKRATTRTADNNWDGTLVSDEQYWSTTNPISTFGITQTEDFETNTNSDGLIFNLFPTKILMGTGVEFEEGPGTSAGDITLEARLGSDTVAGSLFASQLGLAYTDNATLVSAFDGHFAGSSTINLYSNIYKENTWTDANTLLTPARTVSDIYTGQLPDTPTLTNNWLDQGSTTVILTSAAPYYNPASNNQTTGVTGAIKSPLLGAKASFSGDVNTDGIPNTALRGFGQPAFVYFNPNENELGVGNESDTAEPTFSSNKQTKITFVAKLPDQTSSTGIDAYHPYNGYILKEVGLFNDAIVPAWNDTGVQGIPTNVNANLLGGNTALTGTPVNESTHASAKMPYGTLWAHRKIKPIFKDKDVSIEVRWTIYFDESV